MTDTEVKHPVVKGASVLLAWATGMTWGEFASMLAAVYTLLLIVDWFWKRIGRPLAVRRGWVKGSRGFMETTDRASL